MATENHAGGRFVLSIITLRRLNTRCHAHMFRSSFRRLQESDAPSNISREALQTHPCPLGACGCRSRVHCILDFSAEAPSFDLDSGNIPDASGSLLYWPGTLAPISLDLTSVRPYAI